MLEFVITIGEYKIIQVETLMIAKHSFNARVKYLMTGQLGWKLFIKITIKGR